MAWDYALDLCLLQLPDLLRDSDVPFKHSPFFADQLTAFQVWLSCGSQKRSPPLQLPIVLQVKRRFCDYVAFFGLSVDALRQLLNFSFSDESDPGFMDLLVFVILVF